MRSWVGMQRRVSKSLQHSLYVYEPGWRSSFQAGTSEARPTFVPIPIGETPARVFPLQTCLPVWAKRMVLRQETARKPACPILPKVNSAFAVRLEHGDDIST